MPDRERSCQQSSCRGRPSNRPQTGSPEGAGTKQSVRVSDSPRLIRIGPARLDDSLCSVRSGFDRDACERRIAEVAQAAGEWLVLWLGDYASGWIVVRYDGKETHPEYPDLSDLFVRQAARGRGFGTDLIRRAEASAAARGHTMIGLAVNPTTNLRARQLYERLGDVHDGRPMYLDGTYDGVEDWVIDLERPI